MAEKGGIKKRISPIDNCKPFVVQYAQSQIGDSVSTPILTEEFCKPLADGIIWSLRKKGIADSKIRVEVTNPEFWSVSLFVPYKGLKVSATDMLVQNMLCGEFGVERNRIDFFGKDTSTKDFEWYFTHPKASQEILDKCDKDIEESLEAEADEELGLGIPVPNATKSDGECAFCTIKGEFYRAIERGEKTIEYRNLTQYYCDKFFGSGKQVKTIRFQLGYSTADGSMPPQMVYEVKDILLIGEHGERGPSAMIGGKMTTFKDLPYGLVPVSYGIVLGQRIA